MTPLDDLLSIVEPLADRWALESQVLTAESCWPVLEVPEAGGDVRATLVLNLAAVVHARASCVGEADPMGRACEAMIGVAVLGLDGVRYALSNRIGALIDHWAETAT